MPNAPMGTVHADTGEDALALARKRWPNHIDCLGAVSASVFAREQARAVRYADRHVKSVAIHEAAHAVVSHRSGYQVESITTLARLCGFDLAAGTCSHLFGYTHVSGVPTDEELRRPENRADAEKYMISVLVGQIAEARLRGRRLRWGGSEDLRSIEPLARQHAGWCVKSYLAWLQDRAEVTYNPAMTDIYAVAKMLIRRREVTGNEFRRFLCKRASDEQRRQRQRDAEYAAWNQRAEAVA